MESSLRTLLKDERDVFDCNKAMVCIRSVIELGLKPSVGASPPPLSLATPVPAEGGLAPKR